MSISTFGPYSAARGVGDVLFVSGQVGVELGSHLAAGDVKNQTAQAMENIRQVLEEEDLLLGDVVKTTIYLKNITDFADVNEVYGGYFTTPYPARSCVEVAGLPRVAGSTELLVEIEAIADCSKRSPS